MRLTHDGDYRYEHVFLEPEPGRKLECPSFIKITHPDNAPPKKPPHSGGRPRRKVTDEGETHLDGRPRRRRARPDV